MYSLYADLKQRLSQISLLKTITLYNNQLETMEKEEPFLCPAVFISFPEISFQSVSKKFQQGKASITLYIAYESYSEIEEIDGIMGEEGVFLLAELINKVLHGWHKDYFGALARKRMQTANAWGNIYVVAVEYECEFREDSAGIYSALQTYNLEKTIQFLPSFN
ncbi:hypothetical protein [Raineya sp.]